MEVQFQKYDPLPRLITKDGREILAIYGVECKEKAERRKESEMDHMDDICRYAHLTSKGKTLLDKDKKNMLMPADVKRVIIHGEVVVVELTTGKKGVGKCDRNDTFDPYVGFCIAYYKAKNKSNYKLKTALELCIERAYMKGYKHAILNNKAARS